jgi:hypothetical protein
MVNNSKLFIPMLFTYVVVSEHDPWCSMVFIRRRWHSVGSVDVRGRMQGVVGLDVDWGGENGRRFHQEQVTAAVNGRRLRVTAGSSEVTDPRPEPARDSLLKERQYEVILVVGEMEN